MKKKSVAFLALTAVVASVPFLKIDNEDEKEYYALAWHARRDKKGGNDGFCVDLFDFRRTAEGLLRAKQICTDALKNKKNESGTDACMSDEESASDVGSVGFDSDAVVTEPEEA